MCVVFLRFNGGRTFGDDHLSSQLALATICSKLEIMLTMVVSVAIAATACVGMRRFEM